MTTIATDGRAMACDGQVVNGGDTIVESDCAKIVRLNDGSLLGCAGRRVDLIAMADWLNGGDKPEPHDTSSLRLMPDGAVLYYHGNAHAVARAPTAIGSGTAHALTAMDMGADPAAAVRLAALRDPFTGGTITVETLT